jgi:hypothetical protein
MVLIKSRKQESEDKEVSKIDLSNLIGLVGKKNEMRGGMGFQVGKHINKNHIVYGIID